MFCILKSAFALLFHKAQDTFIREKKKNVFLNDDNKWLLVNSCWLLVTHLIERQCLVRYITSGYFDIAT